jgi:hypothetical protein
VEEEFSEIAFPVGRFHPGFIAACYSRIVGDLLHWCAERLSAQSNGRDGGSSGGGVSFSFSYKELIATGLAGALLAFLALALKASPVLIGALSPMASTVIMAIVKAYSSGAAVGGPRLPGILSILGAFWWFASSRADGLRPAILLAGLRAGLVSTVISASVVGGTAAVAHQVAHKDLPCLVWQIGCNHHIQHKQQPSDRSPDAGRGGPYTGDLDGGKYALVATSLLLGSGILSAAILRRR